MSELENRLKQAVSGAGLLYQAHPQFGDWKTTRPGARPNEMSAWVHKPSDGRKSFISLIYHPGGEFDSDGHQWSDDSYEIVVSRGDGTQNRDVATDLGRALEIVAAEMRDIQD